MQGTAYGRKACGARARDGDGASARDVRCVQGKLAVGHLEGDLGVSIAAPAPLLPPADTAATEPTGRPHWSAGQLQNQNTSFRLSYRMASLVLNCKTFVLNVRVPYGIELGSVTLKINNQQRELGQGTKQADNPRSDAFDGEPGSSPDLHLHPTLQPQKNDDSTRTLAPTLPPLNPVALCDPQQDADGVCGTLTGPLHLQRDSAWQCEFGQGPKQADNPRSDAFDGEPGSCPFVVSTVETSNMREVRLGGALGASAAGAGGCAWPL